MSTVPKLVSVAQQLAARVRDDDPATNARWLTHELPDPNDWFRLCFALAAAVPDDKSWQDLTLWAYGDGGPDTPAAIRRRRRELAAVLNPDRSRGRATTSKRGQ
jgi:hypothetical protein